LGNDVRIDGQASQKERIMGLDLKKRFSENGQNADREESSLRIPQPLHLTRSASPVRQPSVMPTPPPPSARPRRSRANSVWINQVGDRVVGLVRLAEAGPSTARITAFRINPEFYRTSVVSGLMQAVIDHCRQHGCFRVLVDFSVAPPWMPSILGRHGFQVLWRHHTWEAILDGSTVPQVG
jgi:hypothetical protein